MNIKKYGDITWSERLVSDEMEFGFSGSPQKGTQMCRRGCGAGGGWTPDRARWGLFWRGARQIRKQETPDT